MKHCTILSVISSLSKVKKNQDVITACLKYIHVLSFWGGGLWQIYIKDETTQSQNAYYLYFSLQRIFRLYVETTLCL